MNRDEKDETDTTKLCDVVLVWKLFWEFLSIFFS
jgi:hypothetical protein